MSKYVEVITSLPIDRTFQYKVTGNESYSPAVGKRVHIPFRSSKRVGYIVSLEENPLVENPKNLIDVIDEETVSPDEQKEGVVPVEKVVKKKKKPKTGDESQTSLF